MSVAISVYTGTNTAPRVNWMMQLVQPPTEMKGMGSSGVRADACRSSSCSVSAESGDAACAAAAAEAAARVDTTNNNTDWTKTKQSHTSLVHDTGLTNGHQAK
jgi:hypothetical protein